MTKIMAVMAVVAVVAVMVVVVVVVGGGCGCGGCGVVLVVVVVLLLFWFLGAEWGRRAGGWGAMVLTAVADDSAVRVCGSRQQQPSNRNLQ